MEMEKKTMVQKLIQGKELAKQLQAEFLNPQSSLELRKSLLEEILATFEKTISMANVNNSTSPLSILDSPQSQYSQQPFLRAGNESVSKKRKPQQKCGNIVKLGTGPEAQGPLEDGHSWRKYGQKEILGAKHQRSYYRCTYSNSQNCPAKKQVQKTDANPFVCEVTYRGTHTCNQSSNLPITPRPTYPNFTFTDNTDFLHNFKANLKVKTEDLDMKVQEPDFSLFTSTLNENFQFFSETTPDSHYFSGYPSSSEQFFEGFSSTSTSPSPMLDMDFSFDDLCFDDSCFVD